MGMELLKNLLKENRLFEREEKKVNKKVFNLILLGTLGVILLLIGSMPSAKENQITESKPVAPAEVNDGVFTNQDIKAQLEEELTAILTQIKGSGKVDVQITLDTGKEFVYARDTVTETEITEEEDNAGGTRVIKNTKEETKMVMVNGSSSDNPVLLKEIEPTVKGVLVVAEGAKESQVKANLSLAAQTALGLPAYKVLVLAKE
jgi:stage III sporulation protein AG